jgi:hypothetical protein
VSAARPGVARQTRTPDNERLPRQRFCGFFFNAAQNLREISRRRPYWEKNLKRQLHFEDKNNQAPLPRRSGQSQNDGDQRFSGAEILHCRECRL